MKPRNVLLELDPKDMTLFVTQVTDLISASVAVVWAWHEAYPDDSPECPVPGSLARLQLALDALLTTCHHDGPGRLTPIQLKTARQVSEMDPLPANCPVRPRETR